MVPYTLKNKFFPDVVPCKILRRASSSTTSKDFVMPRMALVSLLSSGAEQKLSNSFAMFLS
jgi:hypothetical protein